MVWWFWCRKLSARIRLASHCRCFRLLYRRQHLLVVGEFEKSQPSAFCFLLFGGAEEWQISFGHRSHPSLLQELADFINAGGMVRRPYTRTYAFRTQILENMCGAGFAVVAGDAHQAFTGLACPSDQEATFADARRVRIEDLVLGAGSGLVRVAGIAAGRKWDAEQWVMTVANREDQRVHINFRRFAGGF